MLNVVDGFDVVVMFVVMLFLIVDWGIFVMEKGYILSVVLIGMMLGVMFLVLFVDKIGWWNILLIVMVMIGVFMVVIGFIL